MIKHGMGPHLMSRPKRQYFGEVWSVSTPGIEPVHARFFKSNAPPTELNRKLYKMPLIRPRYNATLKIGYGIYLIIIYICL